MKLGLFLSCIAALTCASAQQPDEGAGQRSDAVIWGAMVRGTNLQLLPAEKPIDTELAGRLQKAFAFEQFELVGQHSQLVYQEYESWVVPSREMYLRIDSKGPVDGGMSLHLQLWRDTNILVKTDAVLKFGSPLFIAGPKWGQDQLFFVLELRPKEDASS